MPFSVPWTLYPDIERGLIQWHWRQRAEWKPSAWSLEFAVACDGEVLGTQALRATDFAVTRVVSSGSWLGQRHQGKGLGKEMRSAMLHFAFAGLGAKVARSAAFADNAPSLAISRSLHYQEDGHEVRDRQGRPVRELRFRLEREVWERTRRHDVEIEGLDPCLPLFGLGAG